jgi:glycosyltransferase involved in cell wall biosynthesis
VAHRDGLAEFGAKNVLIKSDDAKCPTQIDQIIPSIIEHDAVSNHTFEAQRLLKEMGYSSEIYVSVIGPGCDGRVRPLGDLPVKSDGSQWVLYQASIGGPAAEVFARHPAIKLLDYHNITRPELVERWIPPLAEEARLGRIQLAKLAKVCSFAFADSAYNAAELDDFGFARTMVVPVLVAQGSVKDDPEPAALAVLEAGKTNGGSDWLFVGQIAPHKAQHDVVRAFACYRKAYDPKARLHLVGREMGFTYRDALGRFVGSLGLNDAVEFPGAVPSDVLAAYFATADVFVCCSDHEGFCAPVIEAMSHGVPVVAYGAAALPETIGKAGVLLGRKDPAFVAAAVHEILADRDLYGQLVAAGRIRASHYSLENAQKAFRLAISEAIAGA